MGKKREFNLYVDGSAFGDTNRYGIGWVRTDHKNRKPKLKSLRLNLERADSTIAEIYAASVAMEYLRQNCTITIHSDCSVLCNTIAMGDLSHRIWKARNNKVLRKAWERLDRSIDRHQEVAAWQQNEGDDLYMKLAHRMAQEGASKPFKRSVGLVDTKYGLELNDDLEVVEPTKAARRHVPVAVTNLQRRM